MSKEPIEHFENVGMNDATRTAPFVDYARCVDADRRPGNHVGDWPEEGQIYPVRVMDSKMDGIPVIHVLGFEGERPFFNAFNPERFEMLLTVWLN